MNALDLSFREAVMIFLAFLLLNEMLFSLFDITCVFVQESDIFFKCHILHKVIRWPQMLYYQVFQENDLFRCKRAFSIHSEDT